MYKKNYNFVFTIFFICFIFAPLVVFFIQPQKEISSIEKRKLSSFPKINKEIKDILAFPKRFDKFYQDHFGLRDTLIRLHNNILLRLFSLSPSPFATKGNNGWFFYTWEGVLQDYLGYNNLNEIEMDNYISIFTDRMEWLDRMGIKYIFVPVPNKINIYDDFLPKRIRKIKGISFYDYFFSLSKDRFKNSVYLYSILEKEKINTQIYLKTDTHWTSEGAFIAFNAIMNFSAAIFHSNKFVPFEKSDLVKKNVYFSGDIAHIMHLEKDISETVPVFSLKKTCTKKTNQQIFESKLDYISLDGCSEKELTALVIHDSFGIGLKPYFNERFKKVIYSSGVQIDKLKSLIRKEKPDIIFEVWVARNMKKIAEDGNVSEEILNIQYLESEKIRLKIDNSFKLNFISQNDAYIQQKTDGIIIQSVSDDPFFAVPFTPTESGERYIAEVNIDSPDNTDFALYFTTAADQKKFKPEYMVERRITKGKNRLLLRLPHPHVKGLLRIDPGKTAGTYLLHSLTIKAVTERAAAFAADNNRRPAE